MGIGYQQLIALLAIFLFFVIIIVYFIYKFKIRNYAYKKEVNEYASGIFWKTFGYTFLYTLNFVAIGLSIIILFIPFLFHISLKKDSIGNIAKKYFLKYIPITSIIFLVIGALNKIMIPQ